VDSHIFPFSIETVYRGATPRLAVSGELDMATAPQLAAAIAKEERADGTMPELDLSRLAFMDVAGMRVLLDAARRAKRAGGRLTVFNPQPAIRRLFALTAVDRTLQIRFDRDGSARGRHNGGRTHRG
jgi:anti-sigma B factor antagonist